MLYFPLLIILPCSVLYFFCNLELYFFVFLMITGFTVCSRPGATQYYTYTYKHTYIYIYTDNESLDFWFLALKHTHEPNLSPPPNLRTPLLLSVDARFGTRWRAAGCYVKWGRSWAPQVVWVKFGRYGWMYWLLLVSSQNGSHLTS